MTTTSMWIDVPYHQQDKSYYCGAAVAQMMIAKPGMCHEQNKLYHRLRDQHWYTSPHRLAGYLSKRLSRAFIMSSDAESGAACERVAHALLTARSAVAAVVMEGQHWVVVTGVAGEATETGEMKRIDGFYFNDPSPVTAYVAHQNQPGILCPPLPHRSLDACGRGGEYGFANTYITVASWLTDYWPPQQDGYITVADMLLTSPRALPLREREACVTVTPGPDAISETQAIACASAQIAMSGIARHGPLARDLGRWEASAARYVDGTTSAYYLVFLTVGGKVVGTATVDAVDGALCSVQAAQTGPEPPVMDRETIAAALRAYGERRRFRKFRTVHDAELVVDPALYWQPCRQSVSRHRPFVRISIRGVTLYRDLHGDFYDELNPAGA